MPASDEPRNIRTRTDSATLHYARGAKTRLLDFGSGALRVQAQGHGLAATTFVWTVERSIAIREPGDLCERRRASTRIVP